MTDKAQKILRLALDAAATDGEWKSAAVMFVAHLRRAGNTVEEFAGTQAPGPAMAPAPKWESNCPKMPFGKYKGTALSEIPADYLTWLIECCEPLPWLRAAVINELTGRRK